MEKKKHASEIIVLYLPIYEAAVGKKLGRFD